MKTVMKKLLSIALAAILLVSAVPFQAAAEENAVIQVPVTVYVDGVNDPNYNKELNVTGDVVLDESLAKSILKSFENRKLVSWESPNGPVTGKTLGYEWLVAQTGYTLTLRVETVKAACDHSYQVDHTKAATCTAAGLDTYTCTKCGNSYTKEIAAAGHTWGEWVQTKAPTATEKGEEKQTCSVCKESQTREVDATGATTYTVKFIVKETGEEFTRTFEKYQTVSDLPAAPKVKNHEFKGWFASSDGTYGQLSNGNKWDGQYTTYYASYKESTKDGMSTMSVYVRFYVGGVQQGNTTWLYDQDFNDGESMLKWLNNNEDKTAKAVFNLKSSSEYEWSPRYYYSYSGNEPLAEQDLIADGDKSIVVKVYSKKAAEANVLLYVHSYNSTSKSYYTRSIHEMAGYTAGNTVTKSAVDTLVKKNYSGTKMTIQGLYTDNAWDQFLAGQNPTAANGIKVSDNGVLKIHVLLKNGTASGNSGTADKTNPKTGDMIFVPMMVMLASAAAVAFVYMTSKKRSVR